MLSNKQNLEDENENGMKLERKFKRNIKGSKDGIENSRNAEGFKKNGPF